MPETEPALRIASEKPGGELRGHVDLVRHDLIRGWAFHPTQSPVTLVVKANGRLIGRITADHFREDMAKAGVGDGHCGFVLKPSGELSRDISYEITVSQEFDKAELGGSPEYLLPVEEPHNKPVATTKSGIINLLLNKYNFKSYLEISSPTTGLRFSSINKANLTRYHRIMYNCPPGFDDGHEITWSSADLNVDQVASEVFRQGLSYDVVFVDSYHTLACSVRDLSFALSILSAGGIIVMHDASPSSVELTAPERVPGLWCGQSYAALIDFLMLHPDLGVYVVDTDWGVAVLRSPNGQPLAIDEALRAAWRALPDDPKKRFDFFDTHRGRLLNLISVDEFLVHERLLPSEIPSRQFADVFPVGRSYDNEQRPDLLRDLARVYAHLGNVAEARRLLTIALAENNEDVFAKGFLAKLPAGSEAEV